MSHWSLEAKGGTSLTGGKYVKVWSNNESPVWLPYDIAIGPVAKAAAYLMEHDYATFDADDLKTLGEQLRKVTGYPSAPLVDRYGWSDRYFVLPDNISFKPWDAQVCESALEPRTGKIDTSGALKSWKCEVAEPLVGQSLPMLAVMVMLAAPLLRFASLTTNPAFELVGRKGTGKTTVQRLAASVLSGVDAAGDQGYYPTGFAAFLSDPSSYASLHADSTIVLEDVETPFSNQSKGKRGEHFRTFAQALTRSPVSARGSGAGAIGTRFMLLSSSVRGMVTLAGNASEAVDLTGGLITLPVTEADTYGVFNYLPPRYASGSDYAEALNAGARAHHGVAFPAFMARLVLDVADDEPGVRRELETYVNSFVDAAAIDRNNGAAMRIGRTFGLLHAAGLFAQRYRVLPPSWDCLAAVLDCYRRSQIAEPKPKPPFAQRVASRAANYRAVYIGHGYQDTLDETRKTGKVFVRHWTDHWELLVRKEIIHKVFNDWEEIKDTPEVEALSIRDGDHRDVQRRLVKGENKIRVYGFRLDKAPLRNSKPSK
jgi:hypothetical protein